MTFVCLRTQRILLQPPYLDRNLAHTSQVHKRTIFSASVFRTAILTAAAIRQYLVHGEHIVGRRRLRTAWWDGWALLIETNAVLAAVQEAVPLCVRQSVSMISSVHYPLLMEVPHVPATLHGRHLTAIVNLQMIAYHRHQNLLSACTPCPMLPL